MKNINLVPKERIKTQIFNDNNMLATQYAITKRSEI